jgi:EAL domain-containing protein (putative c-di-GMP-specific phosphodiesterase class I)
MLQQYGCDLVQGFYLGHPSPHESITLMLLQPFAEPSPGR